MLLGTRMTNNEPSAITDLDVVARYDATDPNYVIKDSSNRISALLDKSKRLVVDEELLPNGYNLIDSNSDGLADGFITFNNVPTTNSIITGNGFPGKAQRCESINTTMWALSIGNITNKKVYKLSFYYRSNKQSGVSDGIYSYATLPVNNGMAIQKEIIFVSNQSGLRPIYFGFFNELDAYIEIGNITVKEIIGNHITQTDITKMPIHTDRYNAVTLSEDIGSWANYAEIPTVISGILDPFNSNKAVELVDNSIALFSGKYKTNIAVSPNSTYTFSIYVKKGTSNSFEFFVSDIRNSVLYFNIIGTWVNGTPTFNNPAATVKESINGYFRVSITFTAQAITTKVNIYLVSTRRNSSDLGSTIFFGVQLEQGNVATKYQRVTSDVDYDTNGFEYYAQFDGVDDYLKSLPFTLNQPTSIYSCLKQVTWTPDKTLYDGIASATSRLKQTSSSPQLGMYAGGATTLISPNLNVGSYGNVYTLFNGVNSVLKINNYVKVTGDAGVSSAGLFVLGSRPDGNLASNISVKEIIIKRIATDESDTIFNYFKNKHNVQY